MYLSTCSDELMIKYCQVGDWSGWLLVQVYAGCSDYYIIVKWVMGVVGCWCRCMQVVVIIILLSSG